MTREEAIKNLLEMRDGMPSDKCQDWIDAISMAVRSLKAWDSVIDKLCQFQEPEDPTLVVTMRIDHFINIINEYLKDYKHLLIKTSAIKNENIKESIYKIIDLIEGDDNNLENKDDNDEQNENVIKISKKIGKTRDNSKSKVKCC